MERLKLYAKIVLNLLIAILALLAVIFVVPKLLSFFMPFVIAWIIAMIANPMVKFMEKRVRILRKHSSAIIIIVVLAAIVILLIFGMDKLIKELSSLLNDLPELYKSLEEQLNMAANKLNGVYDILPDDFQKTVDALGSRLGEFGKNILFSLKTPTINDAGIVFKNIAEVLFLFIITIITSYFFIAERDNIMATGRKVMPKWIAEKFHMVTDNFKLAVGGYFKAQFKIMLVITAILFVGFEILKVNYSFLLAFAIAFLDFLPVFGTGAVIWPWAVFELIVGNYMKAVVLIIIYLICQVIKQILQPKMVGDSIGISPLMTLIFMFIGYKLKGILGLIFGIPIGMVIINFYRAGVFDSLIKSLQILVQDINDFRKL